MPLDHRMASEKTGSAMPVCALARFWRRTRIGSGMRQPESWLVWRLGAPAVGLLLLGGCAMPRVAARPPVASSPPELERRTIRFQEITVELPGPEWHRDETVPSRLDVRRGPRGRQQQSIAIWSVEVPQSDWDLSLHEQASRYLDAVRRPRASPGAWDGFVQGHRQIGPHLYPIMTDRLHYPARVMIADRLFLLYFPEDFAERQRFYVFLWLDFHRENEQARPLDELDAVVSSLHIKPPASVARTPPS